MQKNDRTLWTEGMFLGPQHFQQHDRFLLNTVAQVVQCMGAFAHGLVEYELDAAALNEGRIALSRVSGIFPDGTPFSLPGDGELPLPLVIDSDCRDVIVSLALPFADQQDKDAVETRSAGSFSRYVIRDQQVSDRHSPDSNSEETVFTAGLWSRLTLAGDDHTAFHTIPLARIIEKRDDDRVVLDDRYYPCAMALQASSPLISLTRELNGLVNQRATDLAGRIGTATASDSSQLSQLLLLQILNRSKPLLKHFSEAVTTHPEVIYRELVQLAGELCTITRSGKLAPEFTEYLHRDQYKSFAPLIDTLRESLNWIPDSTTESIPVQHVKAGIYTASIKNTSLFQTSRFILAAKARVTPEELSRRLPRQTTISSKAKLRDLVEAQSQGIALKPVITVPNSIPMYENNVYFEMREDDPLWQEIAVSGDLAMHIAGSYSDLQMQIWAIRK
ncbi:MAG: type VI secretion system baseplate subunit TssK [Granulosicoccus sp.]|nr:type VI secretion system baseplate subunit TssK [Granulosicoccus sp.]